MPKAALKPCAWPGCGVLTTGRHCDEHRQRYQQQAEQKRGTRHQRGYTNRWLRYAKQYLARNPLCVRCKADNRLTPATVVDHIVPHKGDSERFWNPDNHQALCKPCHDRKTATEDGGFGRPIGGGGTKL